jgi:hypothetical protein
MKPPAVSDIGEFLDLLWIPGEVHELRIPRPAIPGSREACETAIRSDSSAAWSEAYKPTLERWGRMMELVDEWETEDVLRSGDD